MNNETCVAVYCYGNRKGDKENDCNAKDGNPFGPFWDTFNIDFVKSEFYASTGANFNTLDEHVAKLWIAKYVSVLLHVSDIYPRKKWAKLATNK